MRNVVFMGVWVVAGLMVRADLLVLGQFLMPDGSVRPGSLAIRGGRVVGFGESVVAARTLDVGSSLVVPGAIDPHVHFRDPGDPLKEDFGSGTRSAAMGGVTTVLDMPNTKPPVFSRATFFEKRALAESKACVDFGLHAGLDAEGMAAAIFPEATCVKIYLGATTGNLLVRDPAVVREALLAAAAAGRTVAVHCESQACLERHAHEADDTFLSHSTSRPAECEAEAIADLASVAKGTGARVHVAHLSSREGLDALVGTGFTAEVTPHHLLFPNDRLREGGHFKMNPPLRSESDLAALWAGLVDGRIACLASDHAPHTPGEKAAARMPECPAGVPGVETLVPILLPYAVEGRIPLARLIEASTEAARVFHLPGKGSLEVGQDADFAVYDLDARRTVIATNLSSRAGWSPFEGMPAIFPTHVAVRGQLVVEDGRFVGTPGFGRFVAPSQ